MEQFNNQKIIMKFTFFFVFILLLTQVNGFSISFDEGEDDSYPELMDWVNSHTPIEIDNINDLDARELFKRGAVLVQDTKTLIVPDGDFVDITSYYDVKSHYKDEFHFAEYDFNNVESQLETSKKTLGTGLDNSKSNTMNSMSYSVGVTNGKTDSIIGNIGGWFFLKFSFDIEFDLSRSGSISESVSCNVAPGNKLTVTATASSIKLTNIKKRPIIITSDIKVKNCLKGLAKGHFSKCLKHDYAYETKDWKYTEASIANGVQVKCKETE